MMAASPADFPFGEFDAVVYQPADRGLVQTGGYRVFPGPADHAFGSVYMGDAGPGPGGRYRGPASVSKQVQHFNRPASIADFFRKPVPVGSLFRKKAGVLKAEWL